MSAAHTRAAAVRLLTRILDHRQTLDEALAQEKSFDTLDGSDRGFARAMASATLRELGRIDLLLEKHVKGRSFNDLDPEVRHLLRVGAAQICCLKTPAHAAVSETVEAARKLNGARRAGGMVNAVLRKLNADSLDRLNMPLASIWPLWFQSWLEQILPGESEFLAEASLQPPPLDLTVKADQSEWTENLSGTPLGTSSVRLTGGVVEMLPGYDEGAWWIQDVAASLPVSLLAPEAGEMLLDLCAAPGGKTLQLAASGADVTAIDRSAKRLRLVQQNLERTRLKARCITADATKWTPDSLFDGVLVDAPCSALGTLRRHPEGPWIKSKEDLSRFPVIQARILKAAADMVKPDGRLVYCVCTPIPQEGKAIVNSFLKSNPDWKRAEITEEEVGVFAPAVTTEGDLLTLPPLLTEEGGCDVFYISRLKRKM